MRLLTLCLLLLLAVAPRAHAFSRVYQPMGNYLRPSPLVIVADIATQSENPFATILTVREILQSDDPTVAVGDEIRLPLGITRWVVPAQAKAALVVMAPAWKTGERGLQVSEVYQSPAQIEAARALLAVYRLPGERAQLLALQELAGRGNATLDEQLLADLHRMRERANFEIALASYPRFEAANRANLLRWLGETGDERALPLLLESLDAPEKEVRAAAAHALEFRFPDAPGVTAAFRELERDPARRALATRYLQMRALSAATPPAPTPWLRAQTLLDQGETDAARAAYFALVEAGDSSWTTLNAAEKLLLLLQTDADKARLAALLNAWLQRTKPDYLQARQTVRLLRALPASDVDGLLALVLPPDASSLSLWDETSGAATFALLERGEPARARGVALVVAQAKKQLAAGRNFDGREATFYACALAWLADDATWRDLPAQLAPAAATIFADLQPLRQAARATDEARALSALIPGFVGSASGNSRPWIIARLGDLRDPVAVAPLFAQLTLHPMDIDTGEIQKALIQIGGPAVEAGALQLLQSPQAESMARALDILHALRGAGVRPLLLQILQTGGEWDRIKAVTLLGYVGLPEDLPLLLPLADFWQTEGVLQNRAAGAVAEIRDRALENRRKTPVAGA